MKMEYNRNSNPTATTDTNVQVRVNVIKRNGAEVPFNIEKIVNAISKANKEVSPIYQMNEYQIRGVAETVAKKCEETGHAVNVEDIQDMVETGIMEMRGYEVAQKYVRYRYKRDGPEVKHDRRGNPRPYRPVQ